MAYIGSNLGGGNVNAGSSWSASVSNKPPPGFVANGKNSYWNGMALITPKPGQTWNDQGGWMQTPATPAAAPTNPATTSVSPVTPTGGVQAGTNSFSDLLKTADPFAQYRGQYATKLNDLMSNPSSIQNTPGYQFAFDQGQGAMERSQAAKGMNLSGNALAELTKYGQGMASQQFNNMANLYSGLAGANQTPAQGTSAAANAFGNLSTAGYQQGNLAMDQQMLPYKMQALQNGNYSNDLSNQLKQNQLSQIRSSSGQSVDPYAGWVFG